MSATSNADPHLAETSKLRRLYRSNVTALINLMQARFLLDPLPRSIWRLIIHDDYVDFDKLHHVFQPHYIFNDKPQTFFGDFTLVKNSFSGISPIVTEAQWLRVFDAWQIATNLLYPHRSSELATYRQIVTNIFRIEPSNPFIAIQFDVYARRRYAKQPFYLGDSNQLNAFLFSEVISLSPSTSP